MADRLVDGYYFTSDEDADLASNELDKIRYISEKLNTNNPEAVLAVYQKLATGKVLVTPLGYEYMRHLQEYLYSCPQIDDGRIAPVPIPVDISAAIHLMKNDKTPEKVVQEKPKKNYKKQYKLALFFNVVLLAVVAAFYVIALKSDYPNIVNYKNQITNEYSSWEQELTKRENSIREKENELGIGR